MSERKVEHTHPRCKEAFNIKLAELTAMGVKFCIALHSSSEGKDDGHIEVNYKQPVTEILGSRKPID